jgi:hypothetical protein
MFHSLRRPALLISWVLAGSAHTASGAPLANDPEPVCAYLARAANEDSLENAALKGRAASAAFPVPQDLAELDFAFKDLLDINNDGKREYFYIAQYDEQDEDPSSLGIQDVRIVRPLSIPRSAGTVQEVFVFDRAWAEIEIEDANDVTKALAEDANRYLVVHHRRSYYLVALRGDQLRYALRTDRSNTAEPVCAFAQDASDPRARTRALTPYEWLRQSFAAMEDPEGMLWEYAFSREDLAVAELLIANGHGANERIGGELLLAWAIDEEREDLVDWLLAHGADVSVDRMGGDELLEAAIDAERPGIALKLMRHGADPAPMIDHITWLQPASLRRKRSLMLAAVDRLGYLPEQFLLAALREDSQLLEVLVKSGVPVRPMGVSWHAGERQKVPFHVEEQLHERASDADKAAVASLFRRETIRPAENFAVVHYGSYAKGVQVIRYAGSDVADDDLLSFATALCYYFLPFDCGSEALIDRALAWAAALPEDCSARYRPDVDEMACRVITYLPRLDRVNTFTVSNSENEGQLKWKELASTYRAKHP